MLLHMQSLLSANREAKSLRSANLRHIFPHDSRFVADCVPYSWRSIPCDRLVREEGLRGQNHELHSAGPRRHQRQQLLFLLFSGL